MHKKFICTLLFLLVSISPTLAREFPDASTIQAFANECYEETLKRTAEAMKVRILDQMSYNNTNFDMVLVDTVEEDAFRTLVGPELVKAHWYWKIKYDIYWNSKVAIISTKP